MITANERQLIEDNVMSKNHDKCAVCGEEGCDYSPSLFYWHEALDRSYVACDHFYEYVQRHPAVQHDGELEKMATKVTDTINKFYQLVGSKYAQFEDSQK